MYSVPKEWTNAQRRQIFWSESPLGFRCTRRFCVKGCNNEKYHPLVFVKKITQKIKAVFFWRLVCKDVFKKLL